MKRLIAPCMLLATILGGCAVVPVEGPVHAVPVYGYVTPAPGYYGYRPYGYHWRHGGYHRFHGGPGWHR